MSYNGESGCFTLDIPCYPIFAQITNYAALNQPAKLTRIRRRSDEDYL